MSQKISADKFAVTIDSILKDCDKATSTAMFKATDETLDEAVEMLKNAGQSRWKKFNRAWKKTIRRNSRGKVEGYAHLKKPYYRIGHLLEFEHASRNGGRVKGFNFIAPVYEKVADMYEEKLTQMVEDGYDE